MQSDPPALTSADQIRALWTQTYGTGGKPDWSHIFPYYHEDIEFQDAIQKVRGIEEFKALCQRLTDRCQELVMHIPTIVMEGSTVFLEWEMTMVFQRTPRSTLYGCTRLTLDEHGRIIRQRDYYDLWGDIFDNIPWFAKRYRRFMHRRFG